MKTLARDQDTAELFQRLKLLRPDSTRRWGKMTAHQAVCHLSDACRMAMGERVVSDASGFAQRTIIKWVALYAPLTWPPNIVTRPEVDQLASGTKPLEFAADVAQLEALLATLAARRGVRWPAHPIFGSMSETSWLRWGYLHTDHHLRQFGV
jgi:Protein of unknown function (DUF1569)